MPEIDPIIIGFLTKNPYTIALMFGVLKLIAKLTPTVTDDKILSLIGGFFTKNKPQ